MNSTLYLEKAENELELANIILRITNNKEIQENVFLVRQPLTFYSAIITHSYYCIFYSTKAYLITKGIKTKPPEEHKKTLLELKKLVKLGIIDKALLDIYEETLIKAESLLKIYTKEKKKRGEFTYQKLSQANKEPAEASLKNARIFFKNMYNLIN